MDQGTIFDQYDPNSSSTTLNRCLSPAKTNGPLLGDPIASGNSALATMMVSILLCPSDSGEPRLPDNDIYGIATGVDLLPAKTNYDFSVEYWQWRCNAWAVNIMEQLAMMADGLVVRED